MVPKSFEMVVKAHLLVYLKQLCSYFLYFEIFLHRHELDSFLYHLEDFQLSWATLNNLEILFKKFLFLNVNNFWAYNIHKVPFISQTLLTFWEIKCLQTRCVNYSTLLNYNKNLPDGANCYQVCVNVNLFKSWECINRASINIRVSGPRENILDFLEEKFPWDPNII